MEANTDIALSTLLLRSGLMLPLLWATMEDEKGKNHEARQGHGVSMAERCQASS